MTNDEIVEALASAAKRRPILPFGQTNKDGYVMATAADRLAQLTDAVRDALEFLDGQVDVDDGHPNNAMRISIKLSEALGERYRDR